MANEITVTCRLRVAKGNLSEDTQSVSKQIDMAGTNLIKNVQTIGTTHEALVLGDVSGGHQAYFRNNDATNYVEIGRDVAATFYPVIKLKAGEFAIAPIATDALYAKANTSPVDLLAFIVED